MKKLLFLSFLSLSITASAQSPFPTMDSLNINNITPAILVHGDMWWNPATALQYCEFPTGTVKNVSSAGALWMSGYDAGGNLHIAAQTYRQNGNDYWPGPLDAGDTLTYATSQEWAKIWKVNQTDIQAFLDLPTHTVVNTPSSILTWPGKGNTYAAGNGGVSLTVTTDMAPFVDINGDGIYEPLQGEYPAIPGQQAAWWVFSDNGPTHNNTNGRPLGMEVHAMAYEYKRGTLIDNVVYYEYTLINRSPNTYTDFRVAQWQESYMGWYSDAYVGFDSIWRMVITYDGQNCNGCIAGNPYGENPPQSAITMIVLPGDDGTNYVPVGSFVYYNNDFSIVGNPENDVQYNNYMRAMLADGEHFSDDFVRAGIQSKGFGSGPDCNYLFTGDPSDTAQWSECVCDNNPGDTRTVLASNDFTFYTGSTQRIVLALLVADSARGCPVANFNNIKIVADTAWGNYYQSTLGVAKPPAASSIVMYPNPVHDELFIENNSNNALTTITVYNIIGQAQNVTFLKNGKALSADVSLLPTGMYLLTYNNSATLETVKFLKE